MYDFDYLVNLYYNVHSETLPTVRQIVPARHDKHVIYRTDGYRVEVDADRCVTVALYRSRARKPTISVNIYRDNFNNVCLSYFEGSRLIFTGPIDYKYFLGLLDESHSYPTYDGAKGISCDREVVSVFFGCVWSVANSPYCRVDFMARALEEGKRELLS